LLNLLGYVWEVSHQWQGGEPGIQRRLARRVRLSAPGKVPLQVDGDPAGELPARIEITTPGARLLVPR
jgi:diacylglycerol kinase family enzyme